MNMSYSRHAGQNILMGMKTYPQMPQKTKMFRICASATLAGPSGSVFAFRGQVERDHQVAWYATARSSITVKVIHG